MLLALVQTPLFGPYRDLSLQGWTVRVEEAELSDASWPGAKAELENQLYRIARVVPDAPLARLRQVLIWVHHDDPGTRCMAYHPAAEYLKAHQMNPEMARGVEIGCASRFVSWTYEQPWMVLHELAHAYHYRFLAGSFENAEVRAAFDSVTKRGLYGKILHWNGKTAKHYALTNPMEYFAECTEAYFGRNDFYPFVNAELKTYDPLSYKLMEGIWGKPQKRS